MVETPGTNHSRITDIQAYDRLPRSSGERQLPENVRIRNAENLQITDTFVRYRYDVEDPVCGATCVSIRQDRLPIGSLRCGTRAAGITDDLAYIHPLYQPDAGGV